MDDDDGDESAGRSFLAAPPELMLFAVFSVLVSVWGLLLPLVGPAAVADVVTPVVGWVPGMPYMLCLAVLRPAFTLDRLRPVFVRDLPPGGRWFAAALLVLFAAFGTVSFARQPANDHPNPYLRVSPWRPAWTVALPLAWTAALLVPPLVRRQSQRRAIRRPADE